MRLVSIEGYLALHPSAPCPRPPNAARSQALLAGAAAGSPSPAEPPSGPRDIVAALAAAREQLAQQTSATPAVALVTADAQRLEQEARAGLPGGLPFAPFPATQQPGTSARTSSVTAATAAAAAEGGDPGRVHSSSLSLSSKDPAAAAAAAAAAATAAAQGQGGAAAAAPYTGPALPPGFPPGFDTAAFLAGNWTELRIPARD